MPTYDYKCEQCGHIFEIVQRITEEPLKFCPECKGIIKRLISAAGIVFKGSGFHVTDYAKKDPKSSDPPKVEAPKTESPKTENPKSETSKS
ncbi:zinc ribbon domain-containing protein [Candidatus Saganbacteria bacterium]|nr:zinc ribbon domain-containing protein [Candidatus Saganbacteria bacterium]